MSDHLTNTATRTIGNIALNRFPVASRLTFRPSAFLGDLMGRPRYAPLDEPGMDQACIQTRSRVGIAHKFRRVDIPESANCIKK
jgi:hypothetical protein